MSGEIGESVRPVVIEQESSQTLNPSNEHNRPSLEDVGFKKIEGKDGVYGYDEVVDMQDDSPLQLKYRIKVDGGREYLLDNETLEGITPRRENQDFLTKDGFKILGFKELSGLPGFPHLLCILTDYGEAIIDPNGNVHEVTLNKEVPPIEVGLDMVKTTQPDGFKIGGLNTTEQIRRLKEINGKPIDDLELMMQRREDFAFMTPEQREKYMDAIKSDRPLSELLKYKSDVFLGYDEKLLDIMAGDNDYALSKGLTHQDLGLPLLYAARMYDLGIGEFILGGKRFQIGSTGFSTLGFQSSPFQDGTSSLDHDLTITNLDTGKTIPLFSTLLGPMIYRYGFYEGYRSKYRIGPEEILKVFDFLDPDKIE